MVGVEGRGSRVVSVGFSVPMLLELLIGILVLFFLCSSLADLNSQCKPNWPQTQSSAYLCLPEC